MNRAETRESLAENLKILLKENNLNRRDVAKSLGIKYSTFCDWTRARTFPKIDDLQKISSFFNVTISQLTEKRNKSSLEDTSNLIILDTKEKIMIAPIGMIIEDPKFSLEYEFVPKSILKPESNYIGFKVFDDNMEPKYSIDDIIIGEEKKLVLEDGDYLLRYSNPTSINLYEFLKVHPIKKGIIVAPLNIENSSNKTSRLYSEEDFYKEFDEVHLAIRVIKDIK